jgi:hypothetical protein
MERIRMLMRPIRKDLLAYGDCSECGQDLNPLPCLVLGIALVAGWLGRGRSSDLRRVGCASGPE